MKAGIIFISNEANTHAYIISTIATASNAGRPVAR